MSKLGNMLACVKAKDENTKKVLEQAIKMEKAGRLRVVNLCSNCSYYKAGWGTLDDGVQRGKCLLAMTSNLPNEYCSKWRKVEAQEEEE